LSTAAHFYSLTWTDETPLVVSAGPATGLKLKLKLKLKFKFKLNFICRQGLPPNLSPLPHSSRQMYTEAQAKTSFI
jgi:hypothetical protein